MINRVEKILLYFLLGIVTFFVTSSYVSKNINSIQIVALIFSALLLILLSKIVVDGMIFLFFKSKGTLFKCVYLFPFIIYHGRRYLFFDPMYFTRSMEYGISDIKEEHIYSLHRFLRVIAVFNVLVVWLIASLLEWSVFHYLPMFIIFFIIHLKYMTKKELEMTRNIFKMDFQKIIQTTQSNPLVDSEYLCHDYLVFFIMSRECGTALERIAVFDFIDEIISCIEFDSFVYSKLDMYMINYWIQNKQYPEQLNLYRTHIINYMGLEAFGMFQLKKFVPLHLKYYFKLIEIIV